MNGVVQPYQYNLTEEQVIAIKQVLGIEPVGYEVYQDFTSCNTGNAPQIIVRKRSMTNDPYGNSTLAGVLFR